MCWFFQGIQAVDGGGCRKITQLFELYLTRWVSLFFLSFLLSFFPLVHSVRAQESDGMAVGNPEAYELYAVPTVSPGPRSAAPAAQETAAKSAGMAVGNSEAYELYLIPSASLGAGAPGARAVIPVPPPAPAIPVTRNREVDRFINHFRSSRMAFSSVLDRTGRYFDLMRMIFSENNLPEDLVYLSVIESGLHPDATSRSGAKGFWQFLESTGRQYGLVINRWVDERRDPVKSTYAAARYLSDLYGKFQSWLLAQAGYNAGENAVEQAVKKGDTTDFWELARKGMLRKETRNFIPKLMAAILIGKNPEQFGFDDVNYMSPLKFDQVPVQGKVDLRVLARLARVSYGKLRSLNPSLLSSHTPPRYPGGYHLRIPPGTRENFARALKILGREHRALPTIHRVASGETLIGIAARYGVNLSSIYRANHIVDARRLQVGSKLFIPVN